MSYLCEQLNNVDLPGDAYVGLLITYPHFWCQEVQTMIILRYVKNSRHRTAIKTKGAAQYFVVYFQPRLVLHHL